MKAGTEWHLGTGGNLQAGYRLNRLLSIGIYSGITYLTGSRMDGMPEFRHRNNFVWESGIRLGFTPGSRKKHKHNRQQKTAFVTAQPVVPAVIPTEQPAVPVHNTPAKTDSLPLHPEEKAETTLVALDTKEEAALAFPNIYFAFNSTKIVAGELPKLQAILEILKAHPQVRIIVTGWCDRWGTASVNNRISLQRAEAVKAWLTGQGIEYSRIKTVGKGADSDELEAPKARRAEVTNEKEK